MRMFVISLAVLAEAQYNFLHHPEDRFLTIVACILFVPGLLIAIVQDVMDLVRSFGAQR